MAVFLAGLLIAFVWWQISKSTAILSDPLSFMRIEPEASGTIMETPVDPRDKALFHLRQGDLFAIRGEWKDAQAEFEKAVDENGGLPALRKLAQAQLQRRDIKGVRSTINKLQSAGARREDLILLESIVELRAGELVKAQSILESSADSPQKHYGLAILSIIKGDHASAKSELSQVISGWEPVLRSNARILQSAYDEFSLFPEGSNLHLITLLSRSMAQVQECELALPLLVQVTSAMEDYRDAWIVQGYCELVTERFESALASFEQAYNIDPQKPEIQYFLARAYASMEQHQNAITFLEYSLVNGFEPKSEARRLIAREALSIGNTALALDQYEILAEDENAAIEIFSGLISASMALGNSDEAYMKAKEAVERWPDDPRALELLGWVSMETGRKDEALSALQKALAINPEMKEAKKRLEELESKR